MTTRRVFFVLTTLFYTTQAKPFLFGALSPQPQKETKHIYHIIQVPAVPVPSFSHESIVHQPSVWENSVSSVDHGGWAQRDNDDKKHDSAEVEHHYHTFDVHHDHVAPTFESSWPSPSLEGYPGHYGDSPINSYYSHEQDSGNFGTHHVVSPQYIQQQPLSVKIYPASPNQHDSKSNNNNGDFLGGILRGARGVFRLMVRGISSASALLDQDEDRRHQNWS